MAGARDADTVTFFNRELSWLQFNDRVLSLIHEPTLPLLERLRFLSIWSNNLDEFFQVRVAGLKAEMEAEVAQGGRRSPDGLSTTEQLVAIREEVLRQYGEIATLFKQTRRELAGEGISITKWEKLSDDEQKHLSEDFNRRVFPVLTPLAVDPGHPFPYISSLSLSIGVLVMDPRSGKERFARIKVPVRLLGRFMQTPDRIALVPLEQVIGANLDQLFPGMTVLEWAAFRITRSADQTVDDPDVEDLLRAVETQLERRRFGDVVRLELFHNTSAVIRALLLEELGVRDSDVYHVKGLIDLASGAGFEVTDRPNLRFDRWEPFTSPLFADDSGPQDLFSVLRQRDVLVHHPYVSFDTSVLELIRQAAHDTHVQAIKLTLYRTAGDGRIVDELIRAAARGKQVVVVVELKARFDEENNIEWARRLERAGVHVTYGLLGLKVHAKALLIVRQESDGIRRYSHIGTGNYNAKTAKAYTDVGLLTSKDEIGNDLSLLFNALTGFGVEPTYGRIDVAPHELRHTLNRLIRNEATYGSSGRIIVKVNSLVDPGIIDELYNASSAGVEIDLIVRGMCSLVPGAPGLSENIRVRSILGRYLEHSRVYHFANGGGPGTPTYMFGSADVMPRNLDRRVEILVPIDDPALQSEIAAMLDVNLAADYLTWELDSTGTWLRLPDEGVCNPQLQIREQAKVYGEAEIPVESL